MSRTRRLLIGGLVLLALATIVAIIVFFRGQATSPETGPTATPTPEPSATMLTAPLTGLPVGEGADLDHPAVAIKVSDVRQAQPQIGVDRADLVFVEPIGVSYTRLLAVFHSDLPDRVGPVRSVRPMDAPLLSPMAPVFGNTMGAQWVLDYVDSVANLDDLGTLRVANTGAYLLDRNRPRPDHVFALPQVLLGLSDFTAAPEPYFDYAADVGSGSASSAAEAGSSVVIPYGPRWQVTWTYDATAGRYLRSQPWGPHRTAAGTRISAINVLVLQVLSAIGKIGSASGAPVPILELVNGSGPFVALAGGHSITGTWSKAGVDDHFQFRTGSGAQLLLSPGNTWVEMAAPSANIVIR